MNSLKKKSLLAFFWGIIDSFSASGIQFIIGIVLARILSPYEFGLIGMLTIFIAISQSLTDSGLSRSLIRKVNCTKSDYNTIFYFNFLVSLSIYLILYFFSGYISRFYNEPILESLIKVLALTIIFNALSIIQRTILIKDLNFKDLAKASFLSSFLSGVISIFLAYRGFGVWSLIVLSLARFGFMTIFLWLLSKWRPIIHFSKKIFFYHFNFGFKLTISGLIDTIYNNIFYLIIGKYYSTNTLGLFTKAEQFQQLPSQNLSGMINKVTYPILSKLQGDLNSLRNAYRKIIRSTMLITFIFMLGMFSVSKSMIIVLLGNQWIDVVLILKILCLVGVFYPLHALNLNILQIQGRADLFLKLEVIKKIIAFPIVFLTISFGIEVLLYAMIFISLISFYFNAYYSGKLIKYPISKQIVDIIPSFLIASSMSFFVYLINFIQLPPIYLLLLQVFFGASYIVFFCEFIRFNDYMYIKKSIFDYLNYEKK